MVLLVTPTLIPGPALRPHPLRGGGTALLLLGLAQLLPLPGMVPALLLQSFHHPRWAALAAFLGMLGATGLVLAMARSWSRARWREALAFRAVPMKVGLWTLLALAGLFLLQISLLQGLDRLHPLEPRTHLLALGPAYVALGGPLFEECLFRGIGLAWLRDRGSDRRALVLSALAFALSHSPVQYLGTFAFGLFLAWLTLRTRSLLLPVLGHAAWNSVGVLGIILRPGDAPPPSWGTLAVLLVLGCALVFPALRSLDLIFRGRDEAARPEAWLPQG
jgi:membrane protease YdiL (CAAX protease family)